MNFCSLEVSNRVGSICEASFSWYGTVRCESFFLVSRGIFLDWILSGVPLGSVFTLFILRNSYSLPFFLIGLLVYSVLVLLILVVASEAS